MRAWPEAVVEGGVEGCVQVVGHAALAIERAAHQLFAVGQQAKRLAHPWVVERRLGGVHVERQPVAAHRFQQAQARVGLQHLKVLGGHHVGHVDLPGAQGRQAAGLVLEVDDFQFIGVGLAGLVVVVETGEQRALARGEALEFVRPGTDRVGDGVVIDRHDAAEVDPGFGQRQVAAAFAKTQAHGA
ncbi:hypothetical protein D3C80_1378990 [compost metagenome]